LVSSLSPFSRERSEPLRNALSQRSLFARKAELAWPKARLATEGDWPVSADRLILPPGALAPASLPDAVGLTSPDVSPGITS